MVAVNDPQSQYSYPARVRVELTEGDPSSYQATADFLNSSNVDLVCLQHECKRQRKYTVDGLWLRTLPASIRPGSLRDLR